MAFVSVELYDYAFKPSSCQIFRKEAYSYGSLHSGANNELFSANRLDPRQVDPNVIISCNREPDVAGASSINRCPCATGFIPDGVHRS